VEELKAGGDDRFMNNDVEIFTLFEIPIVVHSP
jgi:hypothetical protein